VAGVIRRRPLTTRGRHILVAAPLACVAFVASLVPAHRALRFDPMNVVRAE
jgi:ABC-type lipoprotein release transport system permease subunit